MRLLISCLVLWFMLGEKAQAETWTTTTSSRGVHFAVRLQHPRLVRRVPLVDGFRWEFKVANKAKNHVLKSLSSGPIGSVAIDQKKRDVYVTARWRFPYAMAPQIRADRIEIFIPHTINRTSIAILGPGLGFQRIQRWTSAGPITVNAVRADLRHHTLTPQLAQGKEGFSLESVSGIARRSKALAAINGSFFAPKGGMPVGLLMLDGQIVSSNYINRSVFGVRYNGTCFINNAKLRAAVYLSDERIFIANGVNHPAARNQLTLYTSHWGSSTRTVPDPSRREYAIADDGTILSESTGDSAIPSSGFVASAQGNLIPSMQTHFKLGSRAIVYTQLSNEWEGVKSAIGGGPTLVSAGRMKVTAKQEHFGSEIAMGRAPRTAIGYLGGTSVLLVTVDGRQKASVGMTLYELARLMQELGAQDAINLDGGGSTAMVVRGKLVNHPSDGSERAVNNALVIKAAS